MGVVYAKLIIFLSSFIYSHIFTLKVGGNYKTIYAIFLNIFWLIHIDLSISILIYSMLINKAEQ